VTSIQDELADVAERALRAFGGEVTREQAAMLLTMWRYAGDLTPADRTAVLDRFRSVDDRQPVSR
jgi:hypothetical protein